MCVGKPTVFLHTVVMVTLARAFPTHTLTSGLRTQGQHAGKITNPEARQTKTLSLGGGYCSLKVLGLIPSVTVLSKALILGLG